jgi:long-chain acyl-CoA synthetase
MPDMTEHDTSAPSPTRSWNLAARLEEAALRRPDKPVFRGDRREVSYAEFDAAADSVAGGLATLGIGRGDRVAIMAGSHVEHLETLYGVWKAGAIVVAINGQLNSREVRLQLENCRPAAVVADPGKHRDTVAAAAIDLPFQPPVFTTGQLTGSPLRAVWLSPDADASIFYTSGTTGVPKGATHTHRALQRQLDVVAKWYSVTDADEFLSVLPVYLLSILVLGPLLSIHAGATCRLMARYDAWQFAQHVMHDRTTMIGASIPMMFADLEALPPEQAAQVDLSSVRVAGCGGSPMPPEIRRAFEERYDFRFVHAYGGTEGPAVVTTDPFDRDRKFDSVGVPLPHIHLTIEDDEGHDVGPNVIGEVCTSAHLNGQYAHYYEPLRCYWDMPAETAQALRGGRLHWGDLGYLDDEGYLYLVDRKKDMIIRGGMNIYPKEIEKVLYEDPRILECAVVGAPDRRYGEVPWAFVKIAPGAELVASDVTAFVAERSARYKHLAGVSFVDDFPRNALGKVLKRELRANLPGSQR